MRLLALLLGVTASCSDDAGAPGGGGASGSTTTVATQASTTGATSVASTTGGTGGGAGLAWTPCPLFTGEGGDGAECVTTEAPLRWDDPDGPRIDLFVKRVPATSQPARAQIWFLNGGPGASGAAFEGIAEYLAATQPDVDLYMPEHRGIGKSSRLGCPDQEADGSEDGFYVSDAERPACLAAIQAQWGDGLAAFSTSNAARDLGHLVEVTRAPDQQVFVFGVSYGTMLAHRYLQIFPDQPTAVTLDANCVPDCDFAVSDRWFDDLATKLMTACAGDASCVSKLGPDPRAVLTQAVSDLDTGACPEVTALGFDRAVFQQITANVSYDFDQRMLLFALAYRIARCSQADVNALTHFALTLSAPASPSEAERLDSGHLGDNIGVSELWPDPGPTVEEARAELDGIEMALRTSEYYAVLDDTWPRYPRDEFWGQLAKSNVPILMLQGEDDFIPASWVAPAAAHFSGPHQTYVSVPRTAHDALLGSYTTPDAFPCGLRIFEQFIEDPTATLDTSCTEDILPYDFTLLPALSTSFFGTADAWDGDPGPQTIAVGTRVDARALPRRPLVTPAGRLRRSR